MHPVPPPHTLTTVSVDVEVALIEGFFFLI